MSMFLGRDSLRQGKTEEVRERKPKSVQKEDYLLKQIDEFRDKARQLQNLLGTKEQQVRELESLVNEREDKAQELDFVLRARREEADRLIKGVAQQLQNMIDILDQKMQQLDGNIQSQLERVDHEIDGGMQQFQEGVDRSLKSLNDKVDGQMTSLDEKVQKQLSSIDDKVESRLNQVDETVQTQFTQMDEKLTEQLREIDEKVSGQLGESLAKTAQDTQTVMLSVEELKESLEKMKTEINDKIHNEDVKCYRNIKNLIDTQEEQFSKVELSEEGIEQVNRSFGGLKFLAVFALVDCVLLVFFLLFQFGVLDRFF